MKGLGELIEIELRRTGRTRADLARKTLLGPATVSRLIAGERNPRAVTLKLIAEYFRWNYDATLNRIIVDGKPYPLDAPDDNLSGTPTESDPVAEWPELAIAASHFVTIETVGEIVGDVMIAKALKSGRFRVRVRGSCMQPKWLDGDLVEFELMRDGMDFEAGMDVYVETPDGATFKRVVHQDPDTVTIACLNPPGKRWKIERRDISRAAIARFVLLMRPDSA